MLLAIHKFLNKFSLKNFFERQHLAIWIIIFSLIKLLNINFYRLMLKEEQVLGRKLPILI